MRKSFLKGFLFLTLFCVLLALCGCGVSQLSTLPQLAKPYLGVYECEKVTLGGEDYTEKFDSLRLELSYGGEYSLTYKIKNGAEGELRGTYEADPETEEITFHGKAGFAEKEFTFPMKQGKIFVDYSFGGKLLHAVFSAP